MNHTALMSRGPRERSIYLSPGLANGSQCCIKRNALDSACIHSFGLSLGSSECDRLNSTPHSTKYVRAKVCTTKPAQNYCVKYFLLHKQHLFSH